LPLCPPLSPQNLDAHLSSRRTQANSLCAHALRKPASLQTLPQASTPLPSRRETSRQKDLRSSAVPRDSLSECSRVATPSAALPANRMTAANSHQNLVRHHPERFARISASSPAKLPIAAPAPRNKPRPRSTQAPATAPSTPDDPTPRLC